MHSRDLVCNSVSISSNPCRLDAIAVVDIDRSNVDVSERAESMFVEGDLEASSDAVSRTESIALAKAGESNVGDENCGGSVEDVSRRESMALINVGESTVNDWCMSIEAVDGGIKANSMGAVSVFSSIAGVGCGVADRRSRGFSLVDLKNLCNVLTLEAIPESIFRLFTDCFGISLLVSQTFLDHLQLHEIQEDRESTLRKQC